jgi:hypothetical protein
VMEKGIVMVKYVVFKPAMSLQKVFVSWDEKYRVVFCP